MGRAEQPLPTRAASQHLQPWARGRGGHVGSECAGAGLAARRLARSLARSHAAALGGRGETSMNIKLPPDMMPRNNLEASTCKMAEPFNFEKQESKLPPQDSLRSPVAQHNHPNFRLKSPENGNKKNSFLLCEQSKQYLTSQEDNLVVSSNAACINGEVGGSKGERKALPTGNPVSPLSLGNSSPPNQVKTKPSNNESPEKTKKSHKLFENALSVNNPALFSSLGPPLRSTTCHRCGLFGSLRCSQCKQTYYCSTACQRRDWSSHSTICRPVQQSLHKLEDNKLPYETKSIEVKNEQSDCPLGIPEEMTTGAERVMFSDLRSLQLKKTMEIKGTVTEFKNPSNFYVQLYSSEVLEYMNQLSASLKETYANTVPEDGYLPVKGEVCVAKYTVDQTWNRAIIQGIDVLQKKAQVLYIDYGNEEVIPIDRIHQLSKSINLFPPSAIKCFVAGVIPAEGEWSGDCVAAVKALLLEQFCSVKIVDVLEEEVLTCAVDVVLESSGKQLDHVLVEMGFGVKPDEQGADQSQMSSRFRNTGCVSLQLVQTVSQGLRSDSSLLHASYQSLQQPACIVLHLRENTDMPLTPYNGVWYPSLSGIWIFPFDLSEIRSSSVMPESV